MRGANGRASRWQCGGDDHRLVAAERSGDGYCAQRKAIQRPLQGTRFVNRAGHTYAVGTLTGKVGKRSIKPKTMAMPIGVARGASGILGANKAASSAATCPVLHLNLGPLNLNLLGLKVHLNQVILNIDAQSGPGLLLGNLLCGVANLLNTSPLPTAQTTGLLNIVQQLLGQPGLLGL